MPRFEPRLESLLRPVLLSLMGGLVSFVAIVKVANAWAVAAIT